jgi:hypothetical protein
MITPRGRFSTPSSRREFLRTSGLAAFLAPVFLGLPEFAYGQARPKRLVSIFLPNGYVDGCVFVTKDAAGKAILGPGHKPLQPLIDDALFVVNQSAESIRCRYRDKYGGNLSGHGEVAASLFTGHVRNPQDGGRFLAPSLDQIVATELVRTKAFPSEARKSLGILIAGERPARGSGVFARTAQDWTLNETKDLSCAPLPLLADPLEGFAFLFGGMDGNATDARSLWVRDKSLLDEPKAALDVLARDLPREGKALLEAHLDALRSLESELTQDAGGDFSGLRRPPTLTGAQREADPARVFEEWWKLVDMAFRFDRTRVVSVEVGGSAARYRVPGINLPGFEVDSEAKGTKHSDHHSYTHIGGNGAQGLYEYFDWYNQRVVRLVRLLQGDGDATKENLLAQSLVHVTAESGRQHQARNMPTFLLGACGGTVRGQGRVVDLGGTDSAHLGFLVEVGRALGVNGLSRLGNAEYQVKDLKGLLG